MGHVNPGDGYYTIDGFEVRNANDRLISVGGGTGAGSAANCSGVVVKNCYCHHIVSTSVGSNSTGITAYALNGGLIQNNFVTDVVNSTNRNTGIETWSCQSTVIEYNTVVMSNANAGAIFIKNAGQKNIAIRYNYCDLSGSANNSQSAIAWDLGGSSSDMSSLHHNIIIGTQPLTVGIVTGGPDSVEKQQIYNNTFVGNPGFNPGGVRPWGAAGVLTHYNNIYSRASVGGRGDLDVNASSPTLTDYNLFSSTPQLGITPNGSTNYPATYSSLSSWAAALPSGCAGKDAHSVVGAPAFVGGSPTYPAQKYQLGSGSLAKGSGSTNGQASGSSCDMGAWGGASPPARVGCSFVPGVVAPPAVPDAPVLNVS